MTKYNAANERIKHLYLNREKEGKGRAESTNNNIRNAIYCFEEQTRFKNCKQIITKDIIAFNRVAEISGACSRAG